MSEKLVKYFAYERPRPGQLQLAVNVYEALRDGHHLILQEPTGFGKTASVLAGLLSFLEEGRTKVYYATRTHREAEVVLRELERIRQRTNLQFRVLEIRGKRHLCNVALHGKAELEIIDKHCQRLIEQGKCQFYLRLVSRLRELKQEKRNVLSFQNVLEISVAHGICAYYFQKKHLAYADFIIMPYQYITLDHLRRDVLSHRGRRLNLVIDECVAGDSLISVEGGQLLASELFSNNDVKYLKSVGTRNEAIQGLSTNLIIHKKVKNSEDLIQMTTETGRQLKLTGRTSVLKLDGGYVRWTPASELIRNAVIATSEDGTISYERVVDILRVQGQLVYDFEVLPDHNYIANGIIVHNSHNMPFVIADERSWKLKVIDIEEALLEIYFVDRGARVIILELFRFMKENRGKQDFTINPLEFMKQMEERLGNISFNQILEILKRSAATVENFLLSEDIAMKSSLAYVIEFLEEVYKRRLSESFFLQYVSAESFPECYLELSSFDSSSVGRRIFHHFDSVIHVSGTNEWEEAYVALTGVPAGYRKCVVDPPFNEGNVFLATLENMSSRQSERTEEKFSIFSHILAEVLNSMPGKCALYFPSFKVLSAFREIGLENLVEKKILWENENMNTGNHLMMISKFMHEPDEDCLLAGVMGGRSAEGVDFGPGLLKGVLVFGVPFPEPSSKMEKYVEYLNRRFKGKGELYGYSYPAIIKAAQALGRAFRSPGDKVCLILADDRYFSYGLFERFPGWIKKCLKGRYSDQSRLLRELEKFFMADVSVKPS